MDDHIPKPLPKAHSVILQMPEPDKGLTPEKLHMYFCAFPEGQVSPSTQTHYLFSNALPHNEKRLRSLDFIKEIKNYSTTAPRITCAAITICTHLNTTTTTFFTLPTYEIGIAPWIKGKDPRLTCNTEAGSHKVAAIYYTCEGPPLPTKKDWKVCRKFKTPLLIYSVTEDDFCFLIPEDYRKI